MCLLGSSVAGLKEQGATGHRTKPPCQPHSPAERRAVIVEGTIPGCTDQPTGFSSLFCLHIQPPDRASLSERGEDPPGSASPTNPRAVEAQCNVLCMLKSWKGPIV